MKCLTALPLLLLALACQAEMPQAIGQHYASQAGASFTPSAKRGETLFRQPFAVNEKMPGCTSCHTASAINNGQHVVTGKNIRPLAVSANPERFSDPAKVDKWFSRNCREVIGRACTPGEKADFVTYMSEVR